MPKEIRWSKLAENDLICVTDYLLYKWNTEIAIRFIKTVETFTNQIATNADSYPLINKKLKIRKCVITKHNSLYYHETENTIEILRIFDNRQNPRKLKFP